MTKGNAALHITIVGPAWPLRGGGLASFNERLARAFMQEGHLVNLITFSLQYPGFFFPGSTQLSEEVKPPDLDIEILINSVNPATWFSTGRLLKKRKPDIIIVRYWLPFMAPALGTIMRIARKNKHSKIICIADNIIPHEQKPGYNLLTTYFLKSVDAFIIMSRQVMDDLRKFSKTKPATLVAHPLYDNFGDKISKAEARRNLSLLPDARIILFFGFIRKYKGLDLLLEAMNLLKNSPSGSPLLLLAGEYYDEKNFYEDIIEKYHLREQIIDRSGFIPGDEIKNYLCAADVVVQPYRSATQSGVTPLAYHFEVPMIVTNVGGLAEMVPHNIAGLVAEPNAASIADAIADFYAKGTDNFLPGLREEKKKYSWEIMVKEIIAAAGYKL